MSENNPDVYNTIDEYIAQFPRETAKILQTLRETIQKAAPDAIEKISWRMPTFYLFGNLVHFAAHKNHVGFYPGENGIASFKDKLSDYKSSKGAVQFPLNKPMPCDLITEIVTYRAAENIRNADKKKGISK